MAIYRQWSDCFSVAARPCNFPEARLWTAHGLSVWQRPLLWE